MMVVENIVIDNRHFNDDVRNYLRDMSKVSLLIVVWETTMVIIDMFEIVIVNDDMFVFS